VAEGGGLLNRYRGVNPYRGFESLLLRFNFSLRFQGSLLAKVALLYCTNSLSCTAIVPQIPRSLSKSAEVMFAAIIQASRNRKPPAFHSTPVFGFFGCVALSAKTARRGYQR
jgi:hypothetical protein